MTDLEEHRALPGRSDRSVPPATAESATAAALARGPAAFGAHRSVQARLGQLLGWALCAGVGSVLLFWYATHGPRAALRRPVVTGDAGPASGLPELALPPLEGLAAASARPPPPQDAYLLGSIVDGALTDGASSTTPGEAQRAPEDPGARAGARPPAPGREAERLEGGVFVRGHETGSAAAMTLSGGAEELSGAERLAADSPDASGTAHAAASLGSLLQAHSTAAVAAARLATRSLLLPRGSFIDCTLETAIDSTLPGLVTCLTAGDTFSADGTVVLLERGTKLIGETRGEVQPGSARVFVLWTEARTPGGIVVALASPGTDELGRSGLPGQVNRHFWDRFGAAVLVSFVDGAIQAAATSQQRTAGTTVVMDPNGARDVITEVLRSSGAIGPSVIKPQGDRIQIVVARDLDFRTVYELRAR